jgi:3-deoxy-D-manno-octulosonic-acid transferase
MNVLYSLSIHLFSILIRLAAPINLKARQIKEGRKKTFGDLESGLKHTSPIIWVHCASLGEFEQGRPIIEAIRKQHPKYQILITFFSPSGYEIRKDYDQADYICYLPDDTRRNARKLIDLINPEIVFFVKYEFWNYYLHELKQRNIPLYLVSAIFRKDQQFFKNTPWGRWYKKMLFCFTHFFVQDDQSIQLLANIGITNVTRAGDTRFDRVAEIARNGKNISLVEKFKGGHLLVVAGSTWKPDEKLLVEYINNHPDIKFVVAPHETKRSNVDRLISELKTNVVCYTEADEETVDNNQVLIIDTIGILSSIYRYANMAYIGGGFGSGIHNTLEPAIFGMPVLFGPNHLKFCEATSMVNLGIAFTVTNEQSLARIFDLMLTNEKEREQVSAKCINFTKQNLGATQIILDKVFGI